MNNLKQVIIPILFMAILLILVSVNKKLQQANYYSSQYIDADWCSDEIKILRDQVSDMWYLHELDD